MHITTFYGGNNHLIMQIRKLRLRGIEQTSNVQQIWVVSLSHAGLRTGKWQNGDPLSMGLHCFLKEECPKDQKLLSSPFEEESFEICKPTKDK
jgi:hypothetical protein